MGKRIYRQSYHLDSKAIKNLPLNEIKAILRGADPLISQGGRSMLTKILKGSKDKKLLEKELNKCPVYGFFNYLKPEEILAKIDWVILNRYLAIKYDYRLPLLVYSSLGWEIEKDIYSDEVLDAMKNNINYFNLECLKDRNREMIFLLLDKIAKSGDKNFIALLERWKMIDYKKVRKKINGVIRKLSEKEN